MKKNGITVMKFGGSSVKDTECLMRAAEQCVFARKAGQKVVVVVSAPGDMTDDLIERAQSITSDPTGRELDMLLATGEMVSIALLCMAIKEKGHNAISLTGPQAGIRADNVHNKARITDINPKKIFSELKKGQIVVVAGFQGLNEAEDITTLGRGGSDLTAVALAAALKAQNCEIYTDVSGVYTTDPRVVPEAQKIDQISYDEMLELAGSGSQVMQARSIEVAKKFGVVIHVRSSIETKKKGTYIMKTSASMEAPVVSGIAFDKNEAKLSIIGVPDKPGIAAAIFGALADNAINVDMIIQSTARNAVNDISFTINRGDLSRALVILESVKKRLGAQDVLSDDQVTKVSIVGVGMRSHSGVAATMFKAMAENGINIEMISTSEIKVACIVKQSDGDKVVKLLHKTFGLDKKKG